MATQDQTQVTDAAQAQQAEEKQPHGGLLLARRLKAHGVSKLFTLSGGHLFSIYDGCRTEGIDLVDVRHESAAAFAAEGWAKVTRQPGVAALTAGPGVTNGMSAIASAHKNNSPMMVLGRPRAPVPVGPGVAPGDRPRPLRRAAHAVRADRDLHRRDRRPGRRGTRRHADPAHGADLPRPAAGRRLHGGGRGGRHRRTAGPRRDAGRRRPRDRTRGRAAGRGGAAGDHGRHRPLLGSRGRRAARAVRGARHPGVPERPGARMPTGRPSQLLLPRAQRRH